jgi:hypothetical protein
VAKAHKISHGRNITSTLRAKQAPDHIAETWIGTSWIVEVVPIGSRDPAGRTTGATSSRTTFCSPHLCPTRTHSWHACSARSQRLN